MWFALMAGWKEGKKEERKEGKERKKERSAKLGLRRSEDVIKALWLQHREQAAAGKKCFHLWEASAGP